MAHQPDRRARALCLTPHASLRHSEPTHPSATSQAMRVYLDFIRRRHMYLESDGRNLGSKYTLKRILECSDYHFATRYANAMSTSTAQQNIFFGRMDMDQSKGLSREEILRSAYDTDVRPLLAQARLEQGAEIDPLGAYRSSGYFERIAAERQGELEGAASWG